MFLCGYGGGFIGFTLGAKNLKVNLQKDLYWLQCVVDKTFEMVCRGIQISIGLKTVNVSITQRTSISNTQWSQARSLKKGQVIVVVNSMNVWSLGLLIWFVLVGLFWNWLIKWVRGVYIGIFLCVLINFAEMAMLQNFEIIIVEKLQYFGTQIFRICLDHNRYQNYFEWILWELAMVY